MIALALAVGLATHAHGASPHATCIVMLRLRMGHYDGAACVQPRGPVLYKGDAVRDPDTFWILAWEYRNREGDET